MVRKIIVIICLLSFTQNFSQVKGMVYDEYLEPFYNAVVTGLNKKTTTDSDGSFTIDIGKKFPQKIIVKADGFMTETIEIQSLNEEVNVVLKENLTVNQMVVSASRIPERIVESPVAIERIGTTHFKRTTTGSAFREIQNVRGVNSLRNNYSFKSINTRGFSGMVNSRFIQLVDGVDANAVALSFSQGNLAGLNDLDIESIEIMPGASSALYGANAYNGLMLVNTKNPFDHGGISAQIKSGFTQQEGTSNKPSFYDVSIRMANQFSNTFAAKVSFSFQKANEWKVNDYRNVDTWNSGSKEVKDTSIGFYDGLNLYGDENKLYHLINHAYINRKGYKEKDIIKDHNSKNIKLSGGLYFRPFTNKSYEIQLTTSLSLSDYVSQTEQNRYLVKDYYLAQTKFEFKGENFFTRAYYNRTAAENIYDLSKVGYLINQSYSSDDKWYDLAFNHDYNQYITTSELLEYTEEDANRIKPGTDRFYKALKNSKKELITKGGSKLVDYSNFINFEGNYNFSSLLDDWADFQIGGSYRQYHTKSKGTIFNDENEPIRVNEYGVYSQLQKKFIDDKLKITAAFRYDKSQNFEGAYSPRLSINYALGNDKNHVLRISYQTGFRNPTMQEQYNFSSSGSHLNIGSAMDNLEKINHTKDIIVPPNNPDIGDKKTYTMEDLLNNSVLTKSVWGYKDIIKSDYKAVKPETVQTIDLGYRGLITLSNRISLDVNVNGFYSKHKDFTFYQDIVATNYGKVYNVGEYKITPDELAYYNYKQGPDEQGNPGKGQKWWKYDFVKNQKTMTIDFDYANALYYEGDYQQFYFMTNAKSKVNSYGGGISLNFKVVPKYELALSYDFIDYEMTDYDLGTFEPNFNTPNHTVKAHFGNEQIYKHFGFGIDARWYDSYRWVSPFAKEEVPTRTLLDAQLSYSLPKFKSKFKVGGTNLLGKEYAVAPGAEKIGSFYYLSWTINY